MYVCFCFCPMFPVTPFEKPMYVCFCIGCFTPRCFTSPQEQEQAAEGAEEGDGAARKKRRKGDMGDMDAAALLKDDRFRAMFEDADFRVDEQSEEYKQIHPNVVRVSCLTLIVMMALQMMLARFMMITLQ